MPEQKAPVMVKTIGFINKKNTGGNDDVVPELWIGWGVEVGFVGLL